MSILKKTSLITILLIFVSFNICFAIDENQFSQTPQNIDSYQNSVDTTNTLPANENIASGNVDENDDSQDEDLTTGVEATESTEVQPSTKVSSISSTSNSSTISNILNIVLIVVGLLLIFLAIAILIRLH